MHKDCTHHVQDAHFDTIAGSGNHPARAGRVRRVIVRPQQTRFILYQIQRFAFIPDMIARSQNIDLSITQQLVQNGRRHAEPAGRILCIHDRQLGIVSVLKVSQITAQHPPSWPAEYIPYKQYLHQTFIDRIDVSVFAQQA